jgi:hypothetical protein
MHASVGSMWASAVFKRHEQDMQRDLESMKQLFASAQLSHPKSPGRARRTDNPNNDSPTRGRKRKATAARLPMMRSRR